MLGPGKNDGDAAAVRANHSLPNGVGFFYFEVEIVSQGRDGCVFKSNWKEFSKVVDLSQWAAVALRCRCSAYQDGNLTSVQILFHPDLNDLNGF